MEPSSTSSVQNEPMVSTVNDTMGLASSPQVPPQPALTDNAATNPLPAILERHDLVRGMSMQLGRPPSVLILPTVANDQSLMTELYAPPGVVSIATPGTTVPETGTGSGGERLEEGGPETITGTTTATGTVVEAAVPATKEKIKEYTADEHLLSIAQVAERYQTDITNGLSSTVAAQKLLTDGKNILTPPKQTSEWVLYFRQYGNLFLILLEIAAGLGFLAYGLNRENTNIILAGALIALIIFTASINYYQEKSASNVINSIKSMLPTQSKVIRDGHESAIAAENLVKGDLVHLTIGNRVPADIRIIEASDFKVEMSSLTGESDAIECSPEKRSDLPVEARNIIFNSTLVMSGDCRGIVIRTGDATMIGSISSLAGATHGGRTSMEIEILRLVRFISVLAIITACSLFAIGLGRGLGIVFSFVNAFILVLVANVPEGLPATVTSILNLTAQRLAAKNVFIKRTDLIETLGSASVICSDKTGTLTQNKMTVTHMWFNENYVDARAKVRHVPPGAKAIPMLRGEEDESRLEGMTIGRGMSFIALPSGDATAIIHSTTTRPGEMGTALSSVPTIGRGGGGSFRVLSPSQLTRSRTVIGFPPSDGTATTASRRSFVGRPTTASRVPSIASIFPAATIASSGESLVPLSTRRTVSTEGGEATAQIAEEEEKEIEEVGREGENIVTPRNVSPQFITRTRTGAPGNELLLSGFRESVGPSRPTLTIVPSPPHRPGSGTHQLTELDRDIHAVPVDTTNLGTTPPLATAAVSPRRRRFPVPPSEEKAIPTVPSPSTLANEPNEPPPFQSVVSFQSFQGFSSVVWSKANAYTRLCTIAAICNQANFSHEDEDLATTTKTSGRAIPSNRAPSSSPVPVRETPETREIPVLDESVPSTSGTGKEGEELEEGGPSHPISLFPSPATGRPHRTVIPFKHAKTISMSQPVPDNLSTAELALRRGDTLVSSDAFPIRRGESITRFESVLGKKAPPKYVPPGTDTRKILGDATSAALLRYVDALASIYEWRSAYPILYEVPFNSETKWSATITAVPEDSQYHLVFLKGAPERIIDRCTHHFHDGNELPIDDAYRHRWSVAYERFGLMGERVLGFAYRIIKARDPMVYKTMDPKLGTKTGETTSKTATVTSPGEGTNATSAPSPSTGTGFLPFDNLVFAGLISLVDPPKEGTADAIAKCRGASIRVTMVTGDHPLTAEAIARSVGIITLPTAREVAYQLGVGEDEIPLSDERVQAVVLPGYSLPALAEAEWDILLSKPEVVFARTSPQQKLQIVNHYQRLGHIVAVTGDGTNDAPALKAAQIGVSMGSAAASDVAREAADMILMDDNFASIVFACETGRVVFDNIKKTVAYTVAHLWPELIPVFITLTFDVPLMITGLLILVVDLITEQAPAISLSYEPAESSVMNRPPRNLKTERLVDLPLVLHSYVVIGILETLTCIMAFFTVFAYYNIPVNFVGYHRELWTTDSPPLVLDDGNTVLTGPEQSLIYRRAVAAYFLTLVLCQSWHIWFCKTRRISIFRHPIFQNRITLYGVIFAVLVAAFCIYVPAVHTLFSAYYLPIIWWTPHFAFLLIGLAYTEWYKWRARVDPEGRVARYLAW